MRICVSCFGGTIQFGVHGPGGRRPSRSAGGQSFLSASAADTRAARRAGT